MTEQIKDGGPAFPPTHDPETHPSGMTLRDYFAAKAPLHDLKFSSTEAAAAFAGMDVPIDAVGVMHVAMACAAKAAYIYADAMLKAREAA